MYWKYIVISLLAGIVVFHLTAVITMVSGEHYELTSPDYYQQGMDYQKQIDAGKAGQRFEWQLQIDGVEGLVLVRVQQADGTPVQLEELKLDLVKPNRSAWDRQAVLQWSSAEQAWQAKLEGIQPGLWRAHLRGIAQNQAVAHHTRIAL